MNLFRRIKNWLWIDEPSSHWVGKTSGIRCLDQTTFVECDNCGKNKPGAFFEIITPSGKQVVVWSGMPPGWMFMSIHENGNDNPPVIYFACSNECAFDMSDDNWQEFK